MKPAWAMLAAKMVSQADDTLLCVFRVLKRLSAWCLMNNKFHCKVSMICEVKSKENLIKQINIKKPIARLKKTTAQTAILSNPAMTMSPSKKVIPACCRLAK